ncbi:S-layer homology domain-containing protein [Brevibacillus sp. TJ4]|uniref:S-layer homology domain-containing protein n=1 Tax=Brevibacillus sp. TJ4 TaxID=3234853 RepID=UPI003BA13AF0
MRGTNAVPVDLFDQIAADEFSNALNVTEPVSEIVNTSKPPIKGTAIPGSTVSIVIKDATGNPIPGTGDPVAVQPDGSWEFIPYVDLAKGSYTIEVTATKDNQTATKTKALVIVDKTALQTKLHDIQSENLQPADYTAESWQALQTALNTANQVLDDPAATQAQVDQALTALEKARDELTRVTTPPAVDKTALRAKVTETNDENLQSADYTAESWQALQTALNTANQVLDDPAATQAEVNAALSDLQNARARLTPVTTGPTEPAPVDKTALQAKVTDIEEENLESSDYTPQSWKNLQEALKKAEEVLNDPEATQSEVDTALAALEKAYKGLDKIGSDKEVDQSKLEEEIADILDKDLDESEYTRASWRKLEDALEKAQAVLKDRNATQEDVDDALSALRKAYRGLDKPSSRDDDDDDDNGQDMWSNPSPIKPNDLKVETGANDRNASFATGKEETEGGRTITHAEVNRDKLSDILSQEDGQQLKIHISSKGDLNVAGMTAEDVKQLAETESTLDISNLLAIYPVPSSQVDLEQISASLVPAELAEIEVRIDIALARYDVANLAYQQASWNGYELLVHPVLLDMTFTNEGISVRPDKLNGYAPKYIALPDGIDPNRITTGVLVNPDGTVFHVPTVITQIGNRYFAEIHDLRGHGTYSVIWNPKQFGDVHNHWSESMVHNIASRLNLAGTGDNTWSPNQPIDRSQFATIVAYGLGLMSPNPPDNPFQDTVPSSWDYSPISIASQYRIVNGYNDSTFRGSQLITREEGIAMIARAYRLIRPEASIREAEIQSVLVAYNDAAEVSAWAQEAVALMIDTGILAGKEENQLKPKDHMTRSEVVTLLEKLLKHAQMIN